LEEENYELAPKRRRKPNSKDIDRGHALRKVERLPDDTFAKMFRKNREGFAKLLDLISPFLPDTNEQMAINSSGSPISKATKLYATLRYCPAKK
jgi:hypothetical protein